MEPPKAGEKIWCVEELIEFEVFQRNGKLYLVHFQGTCSKVRWLHIPKDPPKDFDFGYRYHYTSAVQQHRFAMEQRHWDEIEEFNHAYSGMHIGDETK